MIIEFSDSKTYTSTANNQFVCDTFKNKICINGKEIIPRKDLLFHLSTGDYVLTLATVLRFIEESLMNNDVELDTESKKQKLNTVREVINDLFYISNNYTLKPKEEFVQK